MKLDIKTAPSAPPIGAVPATTFGNPERVAWLVLFGAFFVCIFLAVSIPLLGVQFIQQSSDPQTSTIQAAPLTPDGMTPVRVTLPNVSMPIAVTDPSPIAENSRIETDQNDSSRAFLTFFDGSTAYIFKNSQLTLEQVRRPRFSLSEQPNSIVVRQDYGVARYAVAVPVAHPGNPDGRPLQFLVRTPHLDAWLNPGGSYSIQVNEGGSDVTVRDGSATVRARDNSRELLVGLGQRVTARAGATLSDPEPAARNLLANGDFSSGELAPSWTPYADQGGDEGNVNGSVGIVTVGDRRAVQIRRTGSNQNSAITGIRQNINQDVSDARSLSLSADVRVDNHNLSGGGYLSSEYPLIFRIKYRDVNGSEAEYVQGFYVQNETRNPTVNGQLIPRGLWIPFDTSNLLEGLDPKPFQILAVEIYASGWDYESYVSNVRLLAE